jgi:thioesterase domain-containing protein
VHGAGGGMFWGYVNLSRHLGPDQPVYGLKSRGLDEREEFGSIEEMAAHYVADLRAARPHGPYYLGGYCFGGNVAYEMARQLQAQGECVALVALLDTAPANAGYERTTWWRPIFIGRFARNLGYWLEDFRELDPAERRRFVTRKLRVLGRKLAQKLRGGRNGAPAVDLEEVIDPVHFPEHELKLWEIHIRAIVEHVERPYRGAVTLFRTRGQPLFCSFEEDFCWSHLAKGGVAIKHIPGSHENVFTEPNVKFLAEALETSLAEAREKWPAATEEGAAR